MTKTVPNTLLVHGGLWEDGMDARRFWGIPGIADGLVDAGHAVLLPDRPLRPADWAAETDHLLPGIPEVPLSLIAASNGCTVGIRLVLALPGRFTRLVLVNPAPAGLPELTRRNRERLAGQGASERTLRDLLTGETLLGVTDTQLCSLALPVALVPPVAEDPWHRRETVDALSKLLPDVTELSPCPPPPHPDFPGHLERFLDEVTGFTAV
jgi:pimeloyl-ACP methyl ester carboxylesterase